MRANVAFRVLDRQRRTTSRSTKRRGLACLVVIAAVVAAALPSTPAGSAEVLDGFVDEVVQANLPQPMGMEFAPDGRLFVYGKQSGVGHVISIVKNGVFLAPPALAVPGPLEGSAGILGLAFHPNFATNGWMYMNRTVTVGGVKLNRVSRLSVVGDSINAASEVVLVDLEPVPAGEILHYGGDIEIGNDGRLYVSTGEFTIGPDARRLTSRNGKILRYELDGTIPADNPFVDRTTGKERAIYAIGLRNPWKMDRHPVTGAIYISDVGYDTWEELNRLAYGADYGWNITEGPTTVAGVTNPDLAYPHDGPDPETSGCAIVGGDFYAATTPSFPPEYVGDYLFADYCNGWIRAWDPATGTVTTLSRGLTFAVDVKVDPATGDVYYLDRELNGDSSSPSGGLGRIRHVGGTLGLRVTVPPIPLTVAIGEAATFSVTASAPPPLSYQWERNGTPVPGATLRELTIPDPQPADSAATFTVVIRDGTSAQLETTPVALTVTANHAPTPQIFRPVVGRQFVAGRTIQFQGAASDAEDGVLPDAQLTWEVELRHGIHTHGLVPETSGISSGSFVIPTGGETDPDVSYLVRLTAVDGDGAVRSVVREVLPTHVVMTLRTEPPGLPVRLDGLLQGTPSDVTGVAGVLRSLEAPAQAIVGSQVYVFSHWSDGGARVHTISTPGSSKAYTAHYIPAPLDTTITKPAANSTVAAPMVIAGSATAPSGVAGVEVAVRDLDSGLWWTGSGWRTTHAKFAATVASPGSAQSSWTASFDPPAVSGRYYLGAVARGADNVRDATPAQVTPVRIAPPLDTTITNPVKGQVGPSPMILRGAATAPGGVRSVTLAVRELPNGRWWNGSAWQSAFVRFPATLAVAGAVETTWSSSFAPLPSTGRFFMSARTTDMYGAYDTSVPIVDPFDVTG